MSVGENAVTNIDATTTKFRPDGDDDDDDDDDSVEATIEMIRGTGNRGESPPANPREAVKSASARSAFHGTHPRSPPPPPPTAVRRLPT